MLKAVGAAPQRAVELGCSPFEQRDAVEKRGRVDSSCSQPPHPPPPLSSAQSQRPVGRSAGRPSPAA